VSAVPDYIEPIVGWRSWLVVRDGEDFRLQSIVYEARWFPRSELIAGCFQRRFSWPWSRGPEHGQEHAPPAPGCHCGIYAAREPEEAACYLVGRSWADSFSVNRVIGTVSLWGRVVECTRGWRGSRAYPKTIYVPTTRAPFWLKAEPAEEIALGLTDYDVPVELLDASSPDPEELVAALGAGTH
jgi:hypothetical protein